MKVAWRALVNSKNVMGSDLGRVFLKYGNKGMSQNWSNPVMSDQELYTGYVYGAIKNRANRVAMLAQYCLKTEANEATMKATEDEYVKHPYLDIIDSSPGFDDTELWYGISTYLDLRGIYYLMAVRNVDANTGDTPRIGKIQKFVMLNPYFITEVRNAQTKDLIGYKETRAGSTRDIPKEMIIPIKTLNPFDNTELFSTMDAAKEYQFILKQAGDFTRQSLHHNVNAPGIITTVEEMQGEELQNFKNRVMGHTKGEPLFGGGKGSVEWNPMQIELDKAALPDITDMNRESVIAVTGASKTMMGIEQSGVTRDSGKIQRDLFTENHSMPQLQIILSALNQDFKNMYPDEYQKTGYKMCIDNPLQSDKDNEIKDVSIRADLYDVYVTLVNAGYKSEDAAKYAEGKITLEELGDPVNPPVTPLVPIALAKPATTPPPTNSAKLEITKKAESKKELPETKEKVEETNTPKTPDVIMNKLDEGQAEGLQQSQHGLQNAVKNVDFSLLAEVLAHIGQATNDFDNEDEVLSARKKKDLETELLGALSAFYGIVIPLYAKSIINRREQQTGMTAIFKLNTDVKSYIKQTAEKVAETHIDTMIDDILRFARDRALSGASRQEIVKELQTKFTDEINRTRAVRVARTETNRAFNNAQYQADLQFIDQNDLGGRAYKQWVTRSADPCPICQALADEPPIPLDDAFATIGDELSATYEVDGVTKVLKQTVSFADLEAGDAHPNCSCVYQLIIE